MAKTYIAHLKSKSPYSQSKHYDEGDAPRLEKESNDAYERRTWRHRMHVTADGHVQIPAMAIKNCLSEAAKFLSLGIKGKGKSTYTKHIEAGVMTTQPIVLPLLAADVDGEPLFVPSDGRRGGGTRVTRVFPLIREWEGEIPILVMDETVTEEVLRLHLIEGGKLIGIGRFRPRNNGFYGRFSLVDLEPATDE